MKKQCGGLRAASAACRLCPELRKAGHSMITKTYKMAEKIIEISALHPDVHSYCAGYEAEGKPDFSVVITQQDIDAERVKSDSEFAYEGLPQPHFSDAQLEETAVYRKIAEMMPQYNTFVFHGSVVSVDGAGYLFTAKSGTGKSTHTSLWRRLFGDRAVMVNDDKPLIRVGGTVTVFGSPYNGKHRLGNNIAVPLRALCILTRAEENRIERITKADAYTMLLQQVYRPQNPIQLAKTLHLIDALAAQTPLYRLGCNMDISAAQVAYNGMKG